MAGLGTDCQQSDHGLCYRQRWTSVRVCCAPDREERFLEDLRSVCGGQRCCALCLKDTPVSFYEMFLQRKIFPDLKSIDAN